MSALMFFILEQAERGSGAGALVALVAVVALCSGDQLGCSPVLWSRCGELNTS